jgi:SpoVK/Ycf46/Vps4 family AAA+-type ATPase
MFHFVPHSVYCDTGDKLQFMALWYSPMKLDEEMYHLARLALAGRDQDIGLFLRRLCRRLRKGDSQELAERIESLLTESPTRTNPTRNAELAAIPTDKDSRLGLLKYEFPVQLDVEPIWEEIVSTALQSILAERQREDALIAEGMNPTRSALFIGPPGVGKTLAARFLARELERPLLVLDLSAVMSSLLGRTGANIRHVLDYAKGVPCVLLFDELDALAKRRNDDSDVGELKRLVTVLLQEIDDWPPTSLLLAATNHPELLDPAIWRRFESIIEFPMPNTTKVVEAVASILETKGVPSDLIKAVAASLSGLSYSEVERELMRACREAVVLGESVESRVLHHLKNRINGLPTSKRKDLGLSLLKLGYSLRSASELAGVHRNTLTSATHQSEQS